MPQITEIDVAILGAGTAGLNALRQVKEAGKSFVLIERGDLGTMCARVGCIPSKAVLHASDLLRACREADGSASAAQLAERANALWQRARATRNESVKGMVDETRELAGDGLIQGDAHIVGPGDIQVGERLFRARAVVIATGSAPVVPPAWQALGDGVLNTDSLFDLPVLPQSIGLIGLGAIGLEMGVALSRLGVRVTGADQSNVVGGIKDPLIAQAARQHFERDLPMWLDEPVDVKRSPSGAFEISSGEDGKRRVEVECVLVAMGRRSTLATLGLEKAGIELDAHGHAPVDPHTMRVGESNFYLAGDVDATRPLQHEAADEGSMAGWNAARHGSDDRWQRRVPLSIAFTNPDIGAIGCPFDTLPAGTLVAEGGAKGNARSAITGERDNVVRLYVAPVTGKLLGAALLAGAGEHLAHLLAWAVQRGETVEQLLQLPFYHPTVEEIVQSALRDAVSKLHRPRGLDLAPAGADR
ncbi:dihydrolipoyl dehydrogenase [Paraburkholderia sp. PREW-6R]|uniref:dihydrolipoyl dehydrogenase n=1 Tax=Paraburkholderia sp. PREW-6R TaxID=3141544 RepID=UPI0031F4EAB7